MLDSVLVLTGVISNDLEWTSITRSIHTVGTHDFIAVITAVVVLVTDERVRNTHRVGALETLVDLTSSYTQTSLLLIITRTVNLAVSEQDNW